MNEKTIRYIVFGIGSLLTLALFWKYYRNFTFASEIDNTMLYYFFKDNVLDCDRSSSSLCEGYAYLLWCVFLAGSIWLQWLFRFKIEKLLRKIHKKA